jgi:hypothetical protein
MLKVADLPLEQVTTVDRLLVALLCKLDAKLRHLIAKLLPSRRVPLWWNLDRGPQEVTQRMTPRAANVSRGGD